ncbi:MAG TPA: hypothetical protein VKQ29_12525 [Aliidongia sp.]|nr:hypothetical protein [Aliidongia sp.]
MDRTIIARLFWVLLVVAVFALAMGLAHAEDAVVISSTVPEQVPGLIVNDTQVLSLPAGGSASLLLRSGQMVRIRGPFEGKLAAATPASAATGATGLIEALRGQGIDASVIGAGRSAAPSARQAMEGQSVAVDPEQSAIYCVGPTDTVWLSRPRTLKGPVRLRRAQSTREVTWPSGAAKIEWPADLMIEDGDRFEALNGASAPVTTMIFRRLDNTPSPAAWIAENLLRGCRQQAEPALRELAHEIADAGNPTH